MSLKIPTDDDVPTKRPAPPPPPKFQFVPSTPGACLAVPPMTPTGDPSIPTGFSPQLYQAYTSNKATDFFFKQLDGNAGGPYTKPH